MSMTPRLTKSTELVNVITTGDQTLFGGGGEAIGLFNGNYMVTYESGGTVYLQIRSADDAIITTGGVSQIALSSSIGVTVSDPDFVQLSNGNVVATWTEVDSGVSSIKAAIFNSAGQKIVQDFLINDPIITDNIHPTVITLAGGGFAVAYSSFISQSRNYEPVIQKFDSNGSPVGNALIINSPVNADTWPDIIELPNGDFQVVFTGPFSTSIFTVDSVTGASSNFNNVTQDANDAPKILLTDAGTLYVYASDRNGSASDSDIVVRLDDGSGFGPEMVLNTSITDAQTRPDVTQLSDGSYVVVWMTASTGTISARRMTSDGTPIGNEFIVPGVGDKSNPSVIDLGEGGFKIIYQIESVGIAGDGSGSAVEVATFGYQSQPSTTGDDVIKVYGAGLEVDGQDGNDIIIGADLAGTGERLLGGSGDDTIIGNDGNDTLFGDGGTDTILGGSGDDIIDGGRGADILDGGEGFDTVDYSSRASAITVDLGQSASDGDSLIGFERVIGTFFDDTLTGYDGAQTLEGGLGNDRLDGGAGDDLLIGGDGADILIGGTGFDVASYANHGAAIVVNLGNGVFPDSDSFTSIEGVIGTSFDDVMTGNQLDNSFSGGDGNDLLEGGLGADALDGGNGFDTATYANSGSGVAVSLLSGTGSGGDTLVNIEALVGSNFNDVLIGNNTTNDIIEGGGGNDGIRGSGGDDTINGGDGNDLIFLDQGADAIDGGTGIDTLMLTTAAAPTVIRLDTGVGIGGIADGDTYTNIENVAGSTFRDVIVGDGGSNTLDGRNGDDVLDGRGGSDTLIGGSGNDELIGGAGFDLLTGGAGADVFVFARGDRVDTITDFENGVDRIDLSDFGYSFAQVQGRASQDGADVVIDTGFGDILRLSNTDLADIDASDFIL